MIDAAGMCEKYSFQQNKKPLNLDIKTKPSHNLMDITTVTVGNSGLRFKIFNEGGNSLMHFTPDNQEVDNSVSDQNKVKFSVVFCAGFYEFYKWWQDEENFKNISKPRFVTGTTNERMYKFRENLFNKEETIYQGGQGNNNEWSYKIDLEKIKESPKLVNFLKKMHERSKRGDIKMLCL